MEPNPAGAKTPKRLRLVPALPRPQLLNIESVSELAQQSKSSTRRDVAKGLMVKPVIKGLRCVRWPADEVNEVYRARAAGADDETVRALVCSLHAVRKYRP